MVKKLERAPGIQRPFLGPSADLSRRINNSRMVAYAVIAVGLINLRYQNGLSGNLPRSLSLVIPGSLILLLSLTAPGKQWLQIRNASLAVMVLGGLLLAYSFIL